MDNKDCPLRRARHCIHLEWREQQYGLGEMINLEIFKGWWEMLRGTDDREMSNVVMSGITTAHVKKGLLEICGSENKAERFEILVVSQQVFGNLSPQSDFLELFVAMR
jgi:hypothetical protein